MIGSKAELDTKQLERVEDRRHKGQEYGGAPWQHDIKYGDNFVVYDQNEDLLIFCHVMEPDEVRRIIDAAAEQAPSLVPTRAADAEIEVMRRIYPYGYRSVEAYSVLDPGGSVRDCHVVRALVTLDDEEFAQMRDIGWDPTGYAQGKHPSKREVIVTLRPVERPTRATVLKIADAMRGKVT